MERVRPCVMQVHRLMIVGRAFCGEMYWALLNPWAMEQWISQSWGSNSAWDDIS